MRPVLADTGLANTGQARRDLPGARRVDVVDRRDGPAREDLGDPRGYGPGPVDLYKACKKHGIKPIVGLEAYLVDDRRAIKEQTRYERNHLTLLAESDTGF